LEKGDDRMSLVDDAVEAVNAVFGDTSVSREETLESLEEIAEVLECLERIKKIEAILKEIKKSVDDIEYDVHYIKQRSD